MRILVACEFSGVVRDAFLLRGHDAVSCDLLPSEAPGPHVQGDVTPMLRQSWDLVLAFPPCTYLSKAGARWYRSPSWRQTRQVMAADFFTICMMANAPRVCVENPVMMRSALALVGIGYDQIIEPWQHGHPFRKKTCLWLKGLPLLEPTNVLEVRDSFVVGVAGSSVQQMERSRTFHGIANAMAAQWG